MTEEKLREAFNEKQLREVASIKFGLHGSEFLDSVMYFAWKVFKAGHDVAYAHEILGAEMTKELLEETFAGYRKPNEVTIPKYEQIQLKVKELAELINDLCPESREKSVALTDLQGVRMWANAAVAIHTETPK